MAASSAPTKKVFFAGDISGNWDKLTSTLESQLKKVGSFDFALATGAVLSPEQLANAQDDAERSILVDDLLTEEKEAPLPTYFVDASPALIEKFGNTGGKIGDNLNFLGSHGVKEVHGLRVAYLSGKYDEEIFFESLDSGNKSEAFVNGGFYTAKAVRDLKQASRAVGNKIDVFLVSEWPEHWERKIVDAFEDHLEPTSLNEKFPPSPAIAELINSLAPRYVLCGERDVFYQRPAFQTMLAKHVTRMICLGRVGSKGKARKWLHAMQITPIDAMSAAELSAKPDDCSPFPFLISTQSGGDGGPGGPDAKRRRRNEDVNGFEAFKAQQDEKELENLDKTHLYLGNLHPGVTEHSFRKTLEKSLGGPDAIVRLRIIMNDQNECKGFGFLQVQTEEIAEQALKLDLEAAGRKIRIEVNKSQAQEKERQQQRQDARRIVVKPHSDCWFCLANPSVQKHLVLAANAHAYLALAKGGIVPQHILLLPVQHIPCFMSVFNFTEFAQIRKTVYGFVHGVKKLFRSGCGGLIPESDCLVWERWVPFPKAEMNHFQIQLFPVPRSHFVNWRQLLDDFAKSASLEFERVSSDVFDSSLPDPDFDSVSPMEDALIHQTRTRFVDPSASSANSATAAEQNLKTIAETPYLYLELPGDGTAKGKRTDRYIGFGNRQGEGRIPPTFARDLVCEGMDVPDRADWRNCQLQLDEEKEVAENVKAELRKVLPKV